MLVFLFITDFFEEEKNNMEVIWNEIEAAATLAANAGSKKEVIAPLKKVPGEVKPIGRLAHEMETFRKSIEKKTLPELKDLLARQNTILSNKKLVAKLPDKGVKVQQKTKQIEELIESRVKAVDEAAEMINGLKLLDTNELEFKHGGAMYKHLNIPDVEKTKQPSTEDSVLGILASKEVPNKSNNDEVYSLDLAQKFDTKITTDDLSKAPFKQIKRSELDTKSKNKVKLIRQQDRDELSGSIL